MNAPRRSDRWSARPQDLNGAATEFAHLQALKAPESVTGFPPATIGPAVTERGPRRMDAAAVRALGQQLSDRDRAILRDFDRFGFLTTSHVQALHFADHPTPATAARLTRRALRSLADRRLVAPVERRLGGLHGGSEATVWRVGLIGDRLLRLDSDDPRARFKEPSARFLDHRLCVADCYVELAKAARVDEFDLIDAQPEPATWRPYLNAGGGPETLKPDLAAVTASGDYEDHWFIEIDRSTESAPIVIKKCQQYEQYRRSGREQQRSGLFPLVVWVVPDERRASQLRRAIDTARSIDPSLHRVVPFTGFRALIRRGAA